jgi:hypothetical protein
VLIQGDQRKGLGEILTGTHGIESRLIKIEEGKAKK